MRAKKPSTRNNSLRTLLLFCVIVAVLILGSIAIKTVNVLRVSKFDGEHRFTLVIQGERRTQIISVEPKGKKASRVFLDRSFNSTDVSQRLSIPIDAFIKVSDVPSEQEDLGTVFQRLVFTFKKPKTDATAIDFFRLWLVGKTIATEDVTTERVAGAGAEGKSLQGLFTDATIDDEKITISIVNAAGVSGLGSRLEQVLTNAGATIVAVTTAPTPVKSSSIMYTNDSYTLQRMSKLLGFPLEKKTEQGLADIIITIGEDTASPKQF